MNVDVDNDDIDDDDDYDEMRAIMSFSRWSTGRYLSKRFYLLLV